jgi:hypothetical protein
MKKHSSVAAFVFAAALGLASAVNAATISIGAAPGAGPVPAPVLLTSGPGAAVFSCGIAACPAATGVFTANLITASGNPILPLPELLGSTSFNVTSTGAGSLRIYVTSQNNTDVTTDWLSTFTSNSLPSGWTVTEETFLDVANGLFTTATALSSVVFNTIGTSVQQHNGLPSGALYSITHLYTIVATGSGSALSTISISQVPGPIVGAGIPGLLAACGGLIALARRRRKRIA